MNLATRVRLLKQWIGPYDYNYGIIFAATFALYSAQTRVYSYEYRLGIPRADFILKSIFVNIVLGLITASLYHLIYLARKNKKITLARYLLEILVVMSGVSFFIYFFNLLIVRPHLGNILGPNDSINTFSSRLVFSILSIAITHNGLRNLKRRLLATSEMNSLLDSKYQALVESDEEIRSQAARYIHDRIQAQITLAGARLTKFAQSKDKTLNASIIQVASDLEKIRSIDLKLVSQILTPNLAAEGLKGSIESLCEQYRSGIQYQIQVDSFFKECDEELLLGVYRIVEQGIINAITHGPASKVSIKVLKTEFDSILVEVSDNGPGANNPKSGTGSVVIDAWCSILGGIKEIESELNHGFTLRVTIG